MYTNLLNSENEDNAMLDEKFVYEILIHSKSLILAIGLYFRASGMTMLLIVIKGAMRYHLTPVRLL